MLDPQQTLVFQYLESASFASAKAQCLRPFGRSCNVTQVVFFVEDYNQSATSVVLMLGAYTLQSIQRLSDHRTELRRA